MFQPQASTAPLEVTARLWYRPAATGGAFTLSDVVALRAGHARPGRRCQRQTQQQHARHKRPRPQVTVAPDPYTKARAIPPRPQHRQKITPPSTAFKVVCEARETTPGQDDLARTGLLPVEISRVHVEEISVDPQGSEGTAA